MYAVDQTCFFFPFDLTPSECAPWVQAWGTVTAILIGVVLVLWQARRQHRALQRQRQDERALAGHALLTLAGRCRVLQIHLGTKLNSRAAVEAAEHTGLPNDMAELQGLERALEHLPLRELDPMLLGTASMVASSLRHYRIGVEALLQQHRKWTDADLDTRFESLTSLSFTLQEAAADLERQLGTRRR